MEIFASNMFGINRYLLSNHLHKKMDFLLIGLISISTDQNILIINEVFGNKVSKFDIKKTGIWEVSVTLLTLENYEVNRM